MSETFRREYRPLTDAEKKALEDLKVKAEELEELFNLYNTPDMAREMALAKTKLEESIMWAVKAITK